MRYADIRNRILRFPYSPVNVPAKLVGIKETEFDIRINFLEEETSKLLTFDSIYLQQLKRGNSKSVHSTLEDVSSGVSTDLQLTLLQSKNHLNFYHFVEQVMEIQKFRTVFKNHTANKEPEIIRFINLGKDPIIIHKVSLDSQHFSLRPHHYPQILQSGEQWELKFWFNPYYIGNFAATLKIDTSITKYPSISYDLYGAWHLSKSYYKIMNRIRYDRFLLDSAYYFRRNDPENKLQLVHVKWLVQSAYDAYRITTVEKRTFKYIWDHYSWKPEARSWFNSHYKNLITY